MNSGAVGPALKEERSSDEDDNVADFIKAMNERFGAFFREWSQSRPGNGQSTTDSIAEDGAMNAELAHLADLIRKGAAIERRIQESLQRLKELQSLRNAHAAEQSRVA